MKGAIETLRAWRDVCVLFPVDACKSNGTECPLIPYCANRTPEEWTDGDTLELVKAIERAASCGNTETEK